MNNSKRLLALSAIVFAVGSAHAFIDQSDYDTTSGWYSTSTPGAFSNFSSYEDFTIGGPNVVRQIGWAGMTEAWNSGVLADNVSGFRVAIYGHDGGNNRPDIGNVIYSADFALANTNAVNVGPGYASPSQAYTHFVSTPDINLGAGTYWLHVGATYIDPGEMQWAWMGTVSAYNNAAANFNHGTATWGVIPEDLSMSLTAVPEPGTFVAIGLGLAGLIVARRRK